MKRIQSPEMEGTIKALSIIRVSDEDQRYGSGPDSQWEDDILENAPRLGLEVCEQLRREIYESATGWEREKFATVVQEALELHRKGEIQAVVFPRVDRETRFVFSSMPLLSLMLQSGLRVYFARELLHLDPKDPEAVSIYLNKVGQSQAYVETMRVNLMRGRRKRASKFKLLPTGGVNLYPYIYDKATGKRIVDPEKYAAIRKMVDWVLKDKLFLNDICRRLMKENIKAPRGGQRWSRATVGRILTNETLTGVTYANKMEAVEPKTRKKKSSLKSARKLRPREEWILLPEDTTPQVITPEEFEALQKQLARNRELSPRNQKFQYLLRGYVYCQECGGKYYGVPEHGKRYYRCRNRSTLLAFGDPCHNRGVNADNLETQVWQLLIHNLFDADGIVESYRSNKGEDSQIQKWQEEMTNYKEKLDLLDNAETRLIRLFEFTPMSEVKYKSEYDKLQTQRSQVRSDISELEQQIKQYQQTELSEKELRAAVVIMRAILSEAGHDDNEDFSHKRRLFELLRLKVWISRDSFSLDFKIPAKEYHIVSQQV